MANKACVYPLQACVFRVTQLDQCGSPTYSECSYAVTDGFSQIELTPNETDGQQFQLINACGRAIVNDQAPPILNWFDYQITMGVNDPEIFYLMTGADIFLDYGALSAGNVVTDTNYATGRFALEIWLGTSQEVCGPGNLPYYKYILLPFTVNGRLTETITVTNDVITFTLAGRTRKGNQWGVGPYNVQMNELLAPSPLNTPLADDAHFFDLITQMPPPEPDCGCFQLES